MAHPETRDKVPAEIQSHIINCLYCSKGLAGISKFIADGNLFEAGRAIFMEKIVGQAKRHFDFVGKIIDCRVVKGFLPLLADTRLSITIPTPITVHLDQCDQCSKDWSKLCALDLSSVEFNTLARFYTELKTNIDSSETCRQPEAIIEFFAKMQFDCLSAEILEHICQCHWCREMVYQKRLIMSNEINVIDQQDNIPCQAVNASGLFTYCLPFGLDPANDQYAKFRTALTSHIVNCSKCLDKLQQLHSTIYSIAERPNSDVLTCYEYSPVVFNSKKPNAPINCSVFKRFMPQFARDKLEMYLPSALSSHLGECDQCSRDCETIADMALDPFQLDNVKQILIGKPQRANVSCSQAQKFIDPFVKLGFDKIDRLVSLHLCTCPDCRNLVYWYRKELIDCLEPCDKSAQGHFLCKDLGSSDVFDHCFPCGGNLSHVRAHQRPGFYQAFISHAPSCSDCLGKIQKLHKTISTIAEHRDSGVVTNNNNIIPSHERQGFLGLDYEYSNYPIKVWVQNKAEIKLTTEDKAQHTESPAIETAAKTIKFLQKIHEKTPAANLKTIRRRTVKAAKYVAAAIIVVILFNWSILTLTTVEAKVYGQIVQAATKIENICIKRYEPDQTQATRKEWVSKTLNIKLFEVEDVFTLRDISNKIKKKKYLSTATVATTPLSEDILAKFQENIKNTLGIVPFEDIADVPEDALWAQITDKDILRVIPGTEVYELSWTITINNMLHQYKWRAFVDADTSLPKRIEWYRKPNSQKDYVFTEYYVITYPTESEINALVESIFGVDALDPAKTNPILNSSHPHACPVELCQFPSPAQSLVSTSSSQF